MHYTYILFSKTLNKFYFGSTSSTPAERLEKHLSNHSGFTGKAKDWIIVYQNEHSTLSYARGQEMQIKKAKSRKLIEPLIQEQR